MSVPPSCETASWPNRSVARWTNVAGQASDPGDVDAVAAVGGARDDAMKEDNLVLPFTDGYVQIGHAVVLLGQLCQLVVVRGEERSAAAG